MKWITNFLFDSNVKCWRCKGITYSVTQFQKISLTVLHNLQRVVGCLFTPYSVGRVGEGARKGLTSQGQELWPEPSYRFTSLIPAFADNYLFYLFAWRLLSYAASSTPHPCQWLSRWVVVSDQRSFEACELVSLQRVGRYSGQQANLKTRPCKNLIVKKGFAGFGTTVSMTKLKANKGQWQWQIWWWQLTFWQWWWWWS